MHFLRSLLLPTAGAAALLLGFVQAPAHAGARRAGGFTTAEGLAIAPKHAVPIAAPKSLDACRNWCWESSACSAFSFDAGSKQCTTSVTVPDLVAADDDVSYGIFNSASQLPKLQAFGKTRANHMDAPGHDLRRIDQVPTEGLCQAACAQTDACKAYVYRESTDTCWLKDAVPQRQQGGGLTSAYVGWDDERSNYPRHLVFRNARLSGQYWKAESTGKKGQAAVEDCRDRCLGQSSCKAALVDPDDGKCRMYRSVVPSSITQDADGTEDRLILRFAFKDGVRFVALQQSTTKAADQPGNDLRMQRIAHGDLCRAVCALDRSCNAVTHNHDWTGSGYKDECYLKTRSRTPTSFGSNFVTTSWLAGDDR